MQWTDDEVWWTFYRITCAPTREYIKWDISGFSYWKLNQNLYKNHLHDSRWDGHVLSLPQNQSRLLLCDLILFSYFTFSHCESILKWTRALNNNAFLKKIIYVCGCAGSVSGRASHPTITCHYILFCQEWAFVVK